MTFLTRLSLRFLAILLTVATAIYFVRAADSRRMPDPGPEHRIHFRDEFSAGAEELTDWRAYLAIEDKLEAALREEIRNGSRSRGTLDRYSPDSATYPGRFDGNWNRSYELSAATPRGVAVLVHGLTDSPYSMLSTAEALAGAGFNVVVPRMPGHGFAVGGLRHARREDWAAAIRIAVRHAMQLPASDQSFVIAGYSNGGLMAIDYALYCEDEGIRCPDKLILLSPAIAVNRFAAVANWHAAVSWMPWFEKFGWWTILPEIDPFKFTSFPKRAGWETYKVSQRVHRRLGNPEYSNSLPPILTFQSVVDDTVSAMAVVDNLYSKLPANGSSLVIYDINRDSSMIHLMHDPPPDPLDVFTAAAPLPYDVTVLRNRSGDVRDIDAAILPAGADSMHTVQTGMSWPAGQYSLSHISLPFRPDDRLYGDGSHYGAAENGVVFGAMAPRGERNVLLLSPAFFLRARHNPFHEYQTTQLLQWLLEDR